MNTERTTQLAFGVSNPEAARNLVVGVGSPHGDDQAGWKVVARLAAQGLPACDLRQLAVPHDLLDSLGDYTSVHLVDSCRSGLDEHAPLRFEIPRNFFLETANSRLMQSTPTLPGTVNFARPPELRSASSHHIDLLTVVELAACLHRLPQHLVLWAIPGSRFGPGEAMSAHCSATIAKCADLITEELGHA